MITNKKQRQLLFEKRWDVSKEINSSINEILKKVAIQILTAIWNALDELTRDVIDPIGGVKGDEISIERSLNQLLVSRIRKMLPISCPFDVEHTLNEFASLKTFRAAPPQPDICFPFRNNPRYIFATEAKILKTDQTVSEYINEITQNFLTCRYSPYLDQGGMLGYLLKGDPLSVLRVISSKLECELETHPSFILRDHRISKHTRITSLGKFDSEIFTCHHLVYKIGKDT